ncbi:MAG TPA: asparagine synthase (glutamine-hydrolyzing) [Acetobacteraceae bacterium]|nr:asparagine synthase (glutamine-hydrolyzing) [Acetobacteraceae bacterium]
MCGLAGLFFGLDIKTSKQPTDERLLKAMTDAIAHRGPDQEGFHREPGLGLGFRRLAIIDLTGGSQPMGNEDASVIIVFNGEIYNFQSLRHELQAAGHVFATLSDTETIIHGWEQWGLGILDRLSGMFALALWDRTQQILLLARDRLGKKPLYYGQAANGALAFGSELAALAPIPGLLGQIDRVAIDDFLTFGYIPDPGSIYQGVRKLPAAHYLLIRTGEGLPEPRCYWSLPAAKVPAIKAEEAGRVLRDKLETAVSARMIAEVPLGTFLSGGIDSGVVTALAARHSPSRLNSFTIGFPGAADERDAAAAMAAHCGAAHFTETANAKGIIAAARDQALIFGEPFGDHSSVPTLAVARLARRHVTVALSGDGGDEIFAGYRRYQWHHIAEAARRLLPRPLRRQILAPIARFYPKLDRAPRWLRAKNTLTEISLDSAAGYYRTLCKTQDQQRRSLFSADAKISLDGHDPAARIVSLFEQSDDHDPLRDAQRVDLATYLPGDILVKVDRTSMAVGLEVRCPILDNEIVAWGVGLDGSLKFNSGMGKQVLRNAASTLIPAEILRRPKQGFAISLAEELRRDTASVRQNLLSPVMLDQNLFEPAQLSRLIDEHQSGHFDHAQPLWLLLVLHGFFLSISQARLPAMAL